MASATLGRLACQKNSFLRELSAKVVSCVRAPDSSSDFDIVFDDSVLFPEGGGQPGDTGVIEKIRDGQTSSVPVTKTFTQDGKCVLRSAQELLVGDEVVLRVDWSRRLDHMQQHSAQHLISAVAKSTLDLNTTTWSLGATKCNVEFDSTSVTTAQLETLESQVNDVIAEARPVTFHYKDEDSDIRVVVIDGLDLNPCCGTHVQHTGQLQECRHAVKFLHTEIARGCTRVWFLAGKRVLTEFSNMFERERQATKLWSCPPEDHIDRLQKLLQGQSIAAKELKSTRFELAELLAQQLAASSATSGLAVLHRPDGDAPFLQAIASAFNASIEDRKTVLMLTAGPGKGEGFFLLTGPDDFVSQNGKTVASLLDGKGGGRKGVFQGKAKSLTKLLEVLELLKKLTT
ncbi:hypothetical protein LEN26_014255 [Aphanomyces euteiches]|nr:hypothetical protein LEN26_014255 [Aphanomyces euteiches]KAH9129826.1 hypothetical protein AeMF1_000174 [Aphanomyces euteiches]KAH9195738.1 hypothetical protein AeNC1_002279 [Aphanomyces euteiches]